MELSLIHSLRLSSLLAANRSGRPFLAAQ
jgi:hypothetical protein